VNGTSDRDLETYRGFRAIQLPEPRPTTRSALLHPYEARDDLELAEQA
jgi:hypothetical protein